MSGLLRRFTPARNAEDNVLPFFGCAEAALAVKIEIQMNLGMRGGTKAVVGQDDDGCVFVSVFSKGAL